MTVIERLRDQEQLLQEDSLKVLTTTRNVVMESQHVRIDMDVIRAVSKTLSRESLQSPSWKAEFIYEGDERSVASYFLLFGTMVFSFWPDPSSSQPKWVVTYKDKEVTGGSFSVMAAFTRAIEEGKPILDGHYLASLSEDEFSTILKGVGTIPMFSERVEILRRTGQTLVEKYDGDFANVVEAANKSAIRLAQILVTDFPDFDDHAIWRERPVYFYKRAQLVTAIIHERLGGVGMGEFYDEDKLTAFADYKIPQMLEEFGCLGYSDDLTNKIKRRELLPFGSQEEVEIRANTIWAVELLRQEAEKRLGKITASQVDHFLWQAAPRGIVEKEVPYHLTRTKFY
ncbi:MAG: queuosine salvage family protein [Candidatus Marinimicrobia bacterium]|nr:queuosine salvage family protein [Candidatus Neomarinimicrobiota bacterium]